MPRDLARTLARTFHAARWATSGGRPVCPRCHDGADLQPGRYRPSLHVGLSSYYCRVCRYAFTDLVGSPLEKTGAPLAQWARVLLADPEIMHGRSLSRRQAIREMRRKLSGSALAAAWTTELTQAGITLEALRRLPERNGTCHERRSA